jgi:hypothetical protein
MVVGLPVVAPARAVIEASMLLSLEAALVSADSALNRQTCTPDQLRRMFARLNHWPGSQRIHVVLHHMDGRAESPGETRSRFMFWRQGLPVPELQFHVYDEGGELVAITDFAWHEQKVFGEFDGQVKYGRLLREGEEPGDAVFREKRREDLVRAITGIRLRSARRARPASPGEDCGSVRAHPRARGLSRRTTQPGLHTDNCLFTHRARCVKRQEPFFTRETGRRHQPADHAQTSNLPASRRAFTSLRNRAASAPSTRRWS